MRFTNRLTESREHNVFTYRNFYNGGGVALGDLTGDGRPELVLTANQGPDRLYLNLGGFRFRDVTREAGLEDDAGWSTGVTLADVDGDGRLDIYICRAGDGPDASRANRLYLHQGLDGDGVPRFAERAAELGVADQGLSTHAAFFDYDRDGLLDLYVVNNSYRAATSFGLTNVRHERHPLGGDRLYRNQGGRFVDVSEAAGIHGSEIAFGLGVAVADFDDDGWLDLYVSNDFFERDYLYRNNGDGTFAERLDRAMPAISYSSMGLDAGDLDGDGDVDLYVTDMLPVDDARTKSVTSFENWETYQAKLAHDYHHQFTRNTLQRNNGDGTFSEVGQLAGVARTDWSWSALIADFDLDGLPDIHVTNGIYRDVTSQDYIAFLARNETMIAAAKGERVDFMSLIEPMPRTPLRMHLFRNRGGLDFADAAADWGLDAEGYSNGAAYGDLDGDGALDLVVNYLDAETAIYRNDARTLHPARRFLQVRLEGEGPNRFAVGARVTARAADRIFVRELVPSRGFQSSVDYLLSFGLGEADTLASLEVRWPDGRLTVQERIPTNQVVTVRQAEARPAEPRAGPAPLLVEVTGPGRPGAAHRENDFVDFQREPLLPRLLSLEGPDLAVADVNGDGLDDLYLGGAKDQAGQLLVQRPGGGFERRQAALFEADRVSEDVGALFADFTGDGRPDLYVVSGGNEFSDQAPALQDRLYLNDGRGAFRKSDGLPAMNVSGSRPAAADFDGDGDLDLFIGGRVAPWRYGLDPESVLLRNDGRGRFENATAAVAPELARVGMVTDAAWTDVDGDGRVDLVLVGDWMPITVFRNRDGARLERLATTGLERTQGWWSRLAVADLTGDGRPELIAGNLGLNSRFRATDSTPLRLYIKDFDGNGFSESILALPAPAGEAPLLLRDELLRALPYLSERFPTYDSYAGQTVAGIFGSELQGATIREARMLASVLATNRGDGTFTVAPLPLEAQLAPIHAILPSDVDGDGRLDLLLAGNFDGFEPPVGRMAASYGLLLRGDGAGGLTPVAQRESGFVVPGQARAIRRLRGRGGELIVVARNDAELLAFRRAR